MKTLFLWVTGVSALVAAFLIDWRAAGLMLIAAWFNNMLAKRK